jgi:hypothetical protein
MSNGSRDSVQYACRSPPEYEKQLQSSEDSKEPSADTSVDDDDYPEGGMRAWLVVLGVSEITFHR